jgi:hypothetical protein
MKALPKLMKNSTVTVDIIFEGKPFFSVCISGSRTWPSIARFDARDRVYRFFDAEGSLIYETSPGYLATELANFGLVFIGVTESRVDFATKSQTLIAKMRAVDLDTHEALHGDNFGYDE